MFFLCIIIILPLISATIDIEIYIKPTFTIGDLITFNYSIISTERVNLGYTPYIECPKGPKPFLAYQVLPITKDTYIVKSYDYIKINEEIEPQICTSIIWISSPIEKTVSKNFSIVTSPSFSFEIKLSKKISIKNEDIYMYYESEVESPDIKATLTYPDKSREQITFPISIKASQIGTYELEAVASKEGYKTITKKTQFGVIEKEAEIKSVPAPDLSEFVKACNADGICDNEENYKNCPQDCSVEEQASKKKINWFIGISIILIVLAIAIYSVIKKRR